MSVAADVMPCWAAHATASVWSLPAFGL
ncbi:hypothetical protein STIAU_1624, partial [Stigmatella aurantiaca DW4/3-1]